MVATSARQSLLMHVKEAVMDERWNPLRRLVAIALWSAANVFDSAANEVNPPRPKRVRKAKALEDRPGWYDRVEHSG